MSTKNYLIDAQTRHAVFVQRYGGGQSKDAIALIERLRKKILDRMANEPTDFQFARLQLLLNDINQIAKAVYSSLSDQINSNMLGFAKSESEFNQSLYNKATTDSAMFALPSDSQLRNALNYSLMSMNDNVRETMQTAIDLYAQGKTRQIMQIINDGVILGDTTPQIANSLSEIINGQHKRQIETLVRTITNHVSSLSRSELFHENADLLEGYQWVATLDARTTLICAGRDGRLYPVSSTEKPPAHWGCRSTTIPIVKDVFNLGSEIKGQRPQRGDSTGTVSGRTPYGGWLRNQSVEFQNEALGVERAKLFRSGQFTVNQFTDPTGRIYTLDELRQTYPLSFN